jgi:hypothetical protein
LRIKKTENAQTVSTGVSYKGQDTQNEIWQRGTIVQFLKVNKTAYERKFWKICRSKNSKCYSARIKVIGQWKSKNRAELSNRVRYVTALKAHIQSLSESHNIPNTVYSSQHIVKNNVKYLRAKHRQYATETTNSHERMFSSSHSKIVGALEESNLKQQSLPILLQQHMISIII